MAFRFPNLFNSKGEYLPNPTEVKLPINVRRPETLAEQVARLVRNEDFRKAVEKRGFESFEDADDFDVEDDPLDPLTPYEQFYDLAAVQAVDKGIVEPPTSKAHTDAKEKTQAYFKRKYKKDATPPAEDNKKLSAGKKTGETPEDDSSTLT